MRFLSLGLGRGWRALFAPPVPRSSAARAGEMRTPLLKTRHCERPPGRRARGEATQAPAPAVLGLRRRRAPRNDDGPTLSRQAAALWPRSARDRLALSSIGAPGPSTVPMTLLTRFGTKPAGMGIAGRAFTVFSDEEIQ